MQTRSQALSLHYLNGYVVFYDGANDTFSTFQNRGMPGIPQNESNRVREFNLLRPQMIRRLYKEVLLATFTNSSTYQVVSSLVQRITGRDLLRVEWNPSVYPPPNQVANEVVRVYRWNITFVRNLGQIYGFKTLFYWQPVVFTKDQQTFYEQEVANKAHGMGQYYEAAATAAKTQLSDVDEFHDILRIDTLCHESFVSQKVVRLSHLTFRKQNMPQTVQNKDQFGLHWQALRVKGGTMSTLQGSLHSPIKDKCVK